MEEDKIELHPKQHPTSSEADTDTASCANASCAATPTATAAGRTAETERRHRCRAVLLLGRAELRSGTEAHVQVGRHQQDLQAGGQCIRRSLNSCFRSILHKESTNCS